MKRQEVAVKLDVDPTTVWRWESGHSEIPDSQKQRLAELFSVSIEHLMGWDRAAA